MIRNKSFFKDKKILITGGTGSFGKKFAKLLLEDGCKKIYIYSRDELKQWEMNQQFDDSRIQFLIGDIRDYERLYRAMNGIDFVVHAAAQKHVPSCEYNPFEAVKTNILGAENIINSAIENKVFKVIALSTDKAVNPLNLYGCTKAVMEKLFINGNAYAGGKDTHFACVRYGNVAESRGSVIPIWKKCVEEGKKLPLTDKRMTRFLLLLDQAVDFVSCAFSLMQGGEIFVPKLSSVNMIDVAKCFNAEIELIGMRAGEKLHETLISNEESYKFFEYENYYICLPDFDWMIINIPTGGKHVQDNFSYSSDVNNFLDERMIKEILCLK